MQRGRIGVFQAWIDLSADPSNRGGGDRAPFAGGLTLSGVNLR
ncbi:hypothetical protein [Phenylobacterium sp.]|nr:hypothetical protein [Phenylobacterium sp.]